MSTLAPVVAVLALVFASATTAVAQEDPAPPEVPASIQASFVDATHVAITWTANSTNEDGFELSWNTGGEQVATTQVAPGTTSFIWEGPSGADTIHCFAVRAFNSVGASDWTNLDEACATWQPPTPFAVLERRPAPSGLTPREQTFPEASPQQFHPGGAPGNGILVVTARAVQARVIIDPPDADVATNVPPINRTPFKISSIPAGRHILEVGAPGFMPDSVIVDIAPGQVARVEITLDPFPR